MDCKIIKAFIGLIAAFILVIAVFGILPQLRMKGPFENFQNPLAGLFEGGKNAAANAALDVSGLKSKAESALRGNTDRIAEATGMSSSQVDAAIDAARQIFDDTERRAAYRTICHTIGEDLPVIPIMYYAHNYVGSDRVQQFHYDAQQHPDFITAELA